MSPIDLARITMQPRFALGRCVATPGALETLKRNHQDYSFLLMMHSQALWVHAHESTVLRNMSAIESGDSIHGVFRLADGQQLWAITEADRSVTTLLLPEEY